MLGYDEFVLVTGEFFLVVCILAILLPTRFAHFLNLSPIMIKIDPLLLPLLNQCEELFDLIKHNCRYFDQVALNFFHFFDLLLAFGKFLHHCLDARLVRRALIEHEHRVSYQFV